MLPKALAAAVASAPGPLQAAAGITNQALGAADKIKKDGPGFLSKIQSYNPFKSRSGPPAPVEYRTAKPVSVAESDELARWLKIAGLR
jgi:hypothetical protein